MAPAPTTPDPPAVLHRGPCPARDALGAVAGKWAVPVIGRLAAGEARFGRLRAQLTDADGAAVSPKALAAELRRLGEAGLVERRARGAAVAYRLTPKGADLVPLLDALADWALDDAPAGASGAASGAPSGAASGGP